MSTQTQTKARRTGLTGRGRVRRNLWPFSAFSTSTTYHVKGKRGPTTSRAATFRGHRIERRPDGGVMVPSIDRDSIFDDVRQAKRFITAQLKYNPAKDALYKQAIAADERFQKALEKKYGSRAGDMRYRSGELPPPIKKLALGYQRAADRWQRSNAGKKAAGRRNLPPTPRPLKRKAQAQLVKTVGEKILRATPYGLLLNGKKRKNSVKKNSLEKAKEVYRKFHGRPPAKTLVVTEPVHVHSHLSGIGDLQSLTIRHRGGHKKTILDFGRGTVLAQNEKRNQLFIRGGDQSVDLQVFGVEKPYHEQEILGEVLSVDYFTRKDHLAPEDGGTATYRHKFGRKKPTLIYSTPDKLLSFAGGGYTIPDEGIDL